MYISVFISAFLAATILPAQSEAILVYQLSEAPTALIGLVTVATVGNVLGAVVNWALGRFLAHHRGRPWFPIRKHKLQQAERQYRKYGRFSLLLSWVPLHRRPHHGRRRRVARATLVLPAAGHHQGSRYIIVAMAVPGVALVCVLTGFTAGGELKHAMYHRLHLRGCVTRTCPDHGRNSWQAANHP